MPSSILCLPALALLSFLALSLAFLSCPVAGQSSAVPYNVYRSFNPVGVAADAAGFVYTAENECLCVIKLSSTGKEVARFNLTATYPPYSTPYLIDVAVDSSGNVYVASNIDSLAPIVKLSPRGEKLAEYAFNRRIIQLQSITVDSTQRVYAVERLTQSVYQFASNGSLLANFTNPQLFPISVAVDDAGFAYVLSYYAAPFMIVKFATNGIVVKNVTGPAVSAAWALAIDSAGCILVLVTTRDYFYDARILTFSPDGVQLSNVTVQPPIDQLSNGPRFRLDSANDILLNANHAIVKLSSMDGTQLAVYNNSAPPFNNIGGGVAFDSAGNFLLSDSGSDQASRYALKLSPSGVFLQSFARNASLGRVQARSPLAVDSEDCVYVLDYALNAVVKLSPAGDVLAHFFTPSLSLKYSTGLAVSADGTVFVTDPLHSRVVAIAPNNTLLATYYAYNPADVAVDAANDIYILHTEADSDFPSVVEKRSADGRSLFNFTTSFPSLLSAGVVTLDAAGRLYIADSGNVRIVKLSPEGVLLAVYATNNSAPLLLTYASAMAVDAAGAHILAAVASRNALIEFFTDPSPPPASHVAGQPAGSESLAEAAAAAE